MTELTMGQRISECRKQQNLSQEALGEKMGVSRQAISKWESDGAIPEVDKLIGLSKLFGVSVGWLLGVEETPEVQPTTEISEELLYKVEEIVKRYQPKQEPLEKKFPWLLSILLFVLAAGIVLLLFWSVFNPKPVDYSAQIAGLESRISALQLQISSNLNEQIAAAEEAASPISSYNFQVEPDTDAELAQITISVVPKLWSESNSASISVRKNASLIGNHPCTWDGAGYTAQLTLPIEDGYEYWFVTGYPDGTQEQTCLAHGPAEHIADYYTLSCNVKQGTGKFNLQAGTLELIDYEIALAPPLWSDASRIFLSNAELFLYHIHGTQRNIADTYELFKPIQLGSGDAAEAVSGVTCYPNGPLQLPELKDGDGLELWVTAELSNGTSVTRLVNAWAYTNGEFIASTPG